MPSKKLSFPRRIHIATVFVFKKFFGYGMIERCGKCNSHKVKLVATKQNSFTYRQIIKCLDCGAKAKTKEVWR